MLDPPDRHLRAGAVAAKEKKMSMITDRDVREMVANVLEVNVTEVESETSFHVELEMDSLQKAEFIVALERACDAEFAPADAAEIDSVRDVMRLLDERHRVP
ncbi:acyl carrier protein [Actinomadura livida]|uniref:Acyl carrier protein n=1 Tax=Actinomadura livida TaxID=79909 RepID=A0A7W7MYC2_9ACTN|nr:MULTISPECIES: acyl carrier protein [Actinomadura]MBB4774665.1 acyl carrier protein [Actinomadura catellatispora]